jgi:small-conductance mechanosensitive channel
MQLNQELKKHGIEFPLPQRDLHLRSAGPTSILREPKPPSAAPESRKQSE